LLREDLEDKSNLLRLRDTFPSVRELSTILILNQYPILHLNLLRMKT